MPFWHGHHQRLGVRHQRDDHGPTTPVSAALPGPTIHGGRFGRGGRLVGVPSGPLRLAGVVRLSSRTARAGERPYRAHQGAGRAESDTTCREPGAGESAGLSL